MRWDRDAKEEEKYECGPGGEGSGEGSTIHISLAR